MTSHRLPLRANRSYPRRPDLDTQISLESGDNEPKHRTKRTKRVKPTIDQQAESQPGQILEIPTEEQTVPTTGERGATMETCPELETQTGNEYIGGGPEGHERRIDDQEVRTIGTDCNAEGYKERSLVRQLVEKKYQFANALDFVKLQLVELVNHLKETGDAKKVEGGQSRGSKGLQGPSRQGEGPSSTMGRGPNYKRKPDRSGVKLVKEKPSQCIQVRWFRTNQQRQDLDEAYTVGRRNQIGAESSWLRKNHLSAFRYAGLEQTSKGILVKLVRVKPDQDIEMCWFR
ncbi:hypothetical protein F511_20178 [Dorcoceras hygrometricum]|uniref:Uncharacterized protein n=1 Tax=Dorcoceras hygrometricum TaxID=472368 RepID=A0A2Z7BJM3_9LAMI|nr:hypothetical protein F511_20178 [Dorcoceras hygrometricum]